jgi:hypothetical protein
MGVLIGEAEGENLSLRCYDQFFVNDLAQVPSQTSRSHRSKWFSVAYESTNELFVVFADTLVSNTKP